MRLADIFRRPKETQPSVDFNFIAHMLVVSIPVGLAIGAAVAGFDYVVNSLLWGHFESSYQLEILCFFPLIAMLLCGLIKRAFELKSSSMANEVVDAYHNSISVLPFKKFLAKLSASIATMGFGASAGMEGASKWLGAMLGAFAQKSLNQVPWLRQFHFKSETVMIAGAAAGIAAIFRAPLSGAVMGIESPYRRDFAHEAFMHALIASAASFAAFAFLRDSDPYFATRFQYVIEASDLYKSIVVGVVAGLGSRLFLLVLAQFKQISSSLSKHAMLNYVVAGVLLSAIAYLSLYFEGDVFTLQSGLPVANDLIDGHFDLRLCLIIFATKLLATAITFGMGGVGGFFVPSATIGAALGAVCDIYLDPSQAGLFTIVGIAAFTGASYNALIFSVVFVAEVSGNPAVIAPAMIATAVAYAISLGVSNSPAQKMKR